MYWHSETSTYYVLHLTMIPHFPASVKSDLFAVAKRAEIWYTMLDALPDEPPSDSPWAPISDGEKMTFRILLPAEFQDIHRRAALAWVHRGHEFSREEWQVTIRAFDLLKEAAVVTQQDILPFPAVYYRYVDKPHADAFIQTLLKADEIESSGVRAWAEIAGGIPQRLRQVGLVPTHQPSARLLIAYCLLEQSGQCVAGRGASPCFGS